MSKVVKSSKAQRKKEMPQLLASTTEVSNIAQEDVDRVLSKRARQSAVNELLAGFDVNVPFKEVDSLFDSMGSNCYRIVTIDPSNTQEYILETLRLYKNRVDEHNVSAGGDADWWRTNAGFVYEMRVTGGNRVIVRDGSGVPIGFETAPYVVTFFKYEFPTYYPV
jgi:hypothetical protein